MTAHRQKLCAAWVLFCACKPIAADCRPVLSRTFPGTGFTQQALKLMLQYGALAIEFYCNKILTKVYIGISNLKKTYLYYLDS